MQVVIHAVPQRMWYVEEFLLPELRRQGADRVEIWNDTRGRGNLLACMDCLAAREGEGGTWHIQDDVLLCSDFVERCRANDAGVVYGFCCEYFLDDPELTGTVYPPDAWNSFQCVRIPDPWARECAAWFFSGAWRDTPFPELFAQEAKGTGDDRFFHEFLEVRHGDAAAVNLAPNLVEHVDLLIGGSVLHQWREYLARAHYWAEPELTEALREQLRRRAKTH